MFVYYKQALVLRLKSVRSGFDQDLVKVSLHEIHNQRITFANFLVCLFVCFFLYPVLCAFPMDR